MPFNPNENYQKTNKNFSISPRYEESISDLRKSLSEAYDNYSGFANQKQPEIKPSYKQQTGETVIDSKVNAFVVIGPDRNAGPESGLGGVGQTAVSSIDLIAGLMGPRPISEINDTPVEASKNFQLDSARIYISQKSVVDSNLKIPSYIHKLGSVGIKDVSGDNKSTVLVISDATRVYGRESVKIATSHIGVTAQANEIEPHGIDIIAGCDVKDKKHLPQPMVKGNNLVSCLKGIINLIAEVQATVTNFSEAQLKINDMLLKHKHQDSTGNVTNDMIQNNILSENLKIRRKVTPDIIANNAEFGSAVKEYFDPTNDSYINSVFNRVN